MTTLNIHPAYTELVNAISAEPVHESYRSDAALPVTAYGIACRIDRLLEGRVYKRWGDNLIWLADESIPTDVVREALQTVAADRVMELMRAEEAVSPTVLQELLTDLDRAELGFSLSDIF
jgi:hypothetical protein